MKAHLRLAGTLAIALALTSSPDANGAVNGAADDQDSSVSASVLAPIDAMFHGMTERDSAAIKGAALPGTILVLMRDGKPEQMTIEAFADRVGKPGKTRIEERIHDPLLRIDHDLAVVWAPFDFLVDGKPDHCGTDLFNLVHTDGKWLIAGIADTGSRLCADR